MAPAGSSYGKDERVLCFHHDILYEAKILDLRHMDPDDNRSPYEYLVHYKGWKGTWDDWVPQERLKKFTEENRELATTLRREVEASLRRPTKPSSRRKTGGSDRSSARGSEERQSSAPRGTKRNRDSEIEKEENFYSRPSVKIVLPDNLKSFLVDDWENITKNRQVVALPAKYTVRQIMDEYTAEEKPNRTSSIELDVLEEVAAGIREYFDKSLDKVLLYKFEREQYRLLREKWDEDSGNLAGKGPLDTYGAEHLCRLFATLPELTAQTNMDVATITRLRVELAKFILWLSKNADRVFSMSYTAASIEYIEKSNGVEDPNPGTATSRLI
ncbi:hypothetical protein PHISP_00999 [Aspergillus sp. HF37]|nr:hypothetical protein PHISP_00999 [Aspergillus sp. HF37]